MARAMRDRAYQQRLSLILEGLAAYPLLQIADVGANGIIAPSYQRLLEAGGCRVLGFEPQKAAFQQLQAQEDGHRRYLQAAVGPAGPAVLNVYPSTGFTSLFKLHEPSLRFLGRFHRQHGKETEVPVTLQPLDSVAGLGRVDLLKIDVQGAEMSTISGGRIALSDAVAVIPELRYHRLYADEPLLGDLDRELRDQGFTLHKLLAAKQVALPSRHLRPELKGIRSQLVDGDAVYIRRLDEPEALSAEQLAHLAVAADAVFDSPDLTLLCLDHLVDRGEVADSLPEQYAELLVRGLQRATEEVVKDA